MRSGNTSAISGSEKKILTAPTGLLPPSAAFISLLTKEALLYTKGGS